MSVLLPRWIESERQKWATQIENSFQLNPSKESVLTQARVAYGLSHLVEKVQQNNLISNPEESKKLCGSHNFVIRFSGQALSSGDTPCGGAWKDIVGIDMISPKMSLQFIEPSHLNNGSLSVQIESMYHPNAGARIGVDIRYFCHYLGVLLYDLFSCGYPLTDFELQHTRSPEVTVAATTNEPPQKKPAATGKSSYTSLLELGCQSSLNLLVESLFQNCRPENDCAGTAYSSLVAVCEDLRQTLLDPDRFLFESQIHTSQSSASNGGRILQLRKGKLYGRENELKLLADAYHRVSAGKSEALFIGGYSGSGKTTLVESFIDQVKKARGFVVEEKLDLMVQEPYSAVIAAFNALCCAIKEQMSSQELQSLAVNLMNEFFSDFFLLVQLLPNVCELCPHLRTLLAEAHSYPQMNLRSVAFILQRFIRTVSSTSRFVLVFLDDIQWADRISLELIKAVMFGAKESSFFFVGSYRDNETDPDHVIFDMVKNLESCGVPSSTMKLEGLRQNDLNNMISDALCIFPHLCLPLSNLVLQNTGGNPFFANQFLKSLVQRKQLHYSLRQKRWIWNITPTISEGTSDVVRLLSSKMSSLDDDTRSALTVMSCFGIKINLRVVQKLSSTSDFPFLLRHLDQAVAEGFITKDSEEFKFVHDNTRQAAYSLIHKNEKDQYHFKLALLLYSVSDGEELIFAVCDQLKKAQDHMYGGGGQIDLVGLFMAAGAKALKQTEYPRAHYYFGVVETLLHNDCWNSQYHQCLKFFLLLAKSRYSCGFVEEAQNALKQILDNGRCLDDKLEAYHFSISISFDHFKAGKAYATCCKVLSQLHEPIPDSVDSSEVVEVVKKTCKTLTAMTDENFLSMKKANEKNCVTSKFFCQASTLSFVVKPEVTPIIVCKWVNLIIENGVSEFSALCFSNFAAMLCYKMSSKDIAFARRIGKLAMSFQKRFDLKEHMTTLILSYYGSVGSYNEPFQSIAEMHSYGFDLGISSGNNIFAFWNALFRLRSGLFAGENLSKLRELSDYYIGLAQEYKYFNSKVVLEQYRETILVLAGKESPSSRDTGSSALLAQNHAFHMAIQSFWLRRHERFEHFYQKNAERKEKGANVIHQHMLMFYHCLNLFHHKKGRGQQKKTAMANQCIKELKEMSEFSDFSRLNFECKWRMIEAGLFSVLKKNQEAKESFESAIASAQKSTLVHEEGLACEHAGIHFMDIGQTDDAMVHFNQAKKCYLKWGSQPKVNFIISMIDKLIANKKPS